MNSGLLPCNTCPWRTDQTAAVIPRYNHAKACALSNTVGDGDAFRPIMACHGSTEGEPFACKGYLARAGWSNVNVRILLAKKLVASPDDILAACGSAGVRLHRTWSMVLAKLSKGAQ